MPVFRLPAHPHFPPPQLAEDDGLLAIGGELSPPWLLLAYSMGIFPWPVPGQPLLWWSPEPRCILVPGDLRISRSLRKVLRQQRYQVTLDRDFAGVINACAGVRLQAGESTWISAPMRRGYQLLHDLGHAHSVECWQDGVLQGGLYGVALERCFFGESMFHRQRNASKVAFVTLAATLFAAGFTLFDCQLPTAHLQSLGGRNVSRAKFLEALCYGGVRARIDPDPAPFPQLPLAWPP